MNINTVNRIFSGTVIGVSGLTPTQMPNVDVINNIAVIAPSANLSDIYLGPSSMTVGNSFPLSPGVSINLHVDNLNLLYVMSESGYSNNISYIGS